MKNFNLLTIGLLMMALAVVGMGGCSAAAPAQTAAERDAIRQQAFEAHPDFWRNRLEPESKTQTVGPIPVGDRRVILRARHVTSVRRTETGATRLPDVNYTHTRIEPWLGRFHELVDADTGKVILPLDYWDIVPVPGVGVYVRTPDERIDSNSARRRKAVPPVWRKLDLATGDMPKTDVRLIKLYVPESEGVKPPETPDPFKRVMVIGRADPASTAAQPMTQLEVYPVYEAGTQPVTQPLVYGRVLGEAHQKNLFTRVGKYCSLAGLDEQGRPLTLLLDEQLRYLLETDQPVRRFYARSFVKGPSGGAWKAVSYLAMTAPGTNPSEDLWVILDENGRFGAPEGVIGYRPLSETWAPDDGSNANAKQADIWVKRWLVRKRTKNTTPFTDYPTGLRGYNTRWTMVDSDFSRLPYTPHMWDVQLVRVPWIDRRQDNTTGFFNEYTDGKQYERVFMACIQKEQWTIVDPFGKSKSDREFSQVFATIDGPSQVVPKLTEMHQREVAFRAKLQQAREADIARKAQEALEKRRAWIETNWNRCLKNGNYQWCASVADERGGSSWFEMAKAMDYPTTEFVQYVMARTTSEPQTRELERMLALAKQRDSQALADFMAKEKERERLRWLAANPPDPASYSSGGGSSRSSIGGGMTAGWKVSDHQKRAYMKALGTSQHRTNMGWSNPYAY